MTIVLVMVASNMVVHPFALAAGLVSGQCREVNLDKKIVSCEVNYCENRVVASKKAHNKPTFKAASLYKTNWQPQATELSLAENEVLHGYHSMTAYTSEAAQTDASPCTTANGFNVCEHGIEDTVAANFLPFGSRVKIPDLFGDKIFIVRDRMNSRYSERMDVWMKEKDSALRFGVRTARVVVLK